MFVNSDNKKNYLKIWLLTIFILIVAMVAIGGLTRLTDSGLSITHWELFSGLLPPLNIHEWNYYFDEYKKIPEFKIINYNISLEEFKVIFYWEYIHRLLARVVGLFSIIPLLYFLYKYKISFSFLKKYFSIFILICLQGFIGWYMVKSGLVNNIDVSHYRLSVHLVLALSILSLTFWFILDLQEIEKFHIKLPYLLLNLILFFIFIQIILGAFLAGLNGGLIYNTWPDMNGKFLPDDVFVHNFLSAELLNNPSIIQFLHRLIAYFLLISIIFLNFLFFKNRLNFKLIIIFNFFILLQIFLGILTLLTGVEIKYASLHQLGSILVLCSYILIFYKNKKN